MRPPGRFLFQLVVLLLVSFALPRALPGDPLALLSGGGGQDAPIVLSDQTRARLAAYYGLDRPLPAQLLHFAGESLRGDLGFSISYTRPVNQLIAGRTLWTLALVVPSLLLATALGCLLGAIAAWHDQRRNQRWLAALLLLIGSLPEFVVGIGLIVLFGAWLRLLPTSGGATPFQNCSGTAALAGCAADRVSHALLPILVLTAAQLPVFFLMMRASTIDELAEPYVLVARGRGLSEQTVAVRHAGRNAILPVVSLFGLRLGAMLGGVVVVETLFAYPGLGQLAFRAAVARDFPLLQALVLLGGVVILLANAAADLVRVRLDPRLRLEPAT